jgi:iron complex outermembrane recepter protein
VPNTALTSPVVYAPYIIRRPNPADAAATAAYNALVLSFLTDPDLQSPVEPIANINAIVDGRRANLGSVKQTGIDLSLGYAFATDMGDWRVGFDIAKILELTRSTAPGLPYVDVLDTFGNPVDLRGRASLNWGFGGWSANAYFNYINAYTNTAVTPNTEVESYDTVDVSLSYAFTAASGFLDGLSASLSVQDLFDTDPPIVLNGTVSWDNQNVSPLGRFVSFTLAKSW